MKAAVSQEDEGVSVNMSATSGYFYQYWPGGGRIAVDPGDFGGVLVTIKARLIVDDPEKPDDRNRV